jgi:amino acid transporter
LGGAMSLIGALCYAELATAYPHVGGNYHYLMRAFVDTPQPKGVRILASSVLPR